MSESSPNVPRSNGPTDDQLMTSWARITLDFGDSGFEVSEDVEEEKETPQSADALRSEIERMIGMIRQVAQQNTGDQSGIVDSVAEHEELTEEIFQKMLQGSEEGDFPDSENLMSHEEATFSESSDSDSPGQDSDSSLNEDSFEEAPNTLDPEVEKRALEATTDDIVQALLLASVDRPEVMVYEASEEHVDVFVLVIEDEDGVLHTAQLGEDGKVQAGLEFEEFAAELMEELPVRGGLCASQDSYSCSRPVTVLGEELTVDAYSTVAALVELGMPQIPYLVHNTFVVGAVEVVPADNGWSMISTDPVSLLNLLQNLGKPAIVAEAREGRQHLSFIVPGGQSEQRESKGTWGEWMNQVVGSPVAQDVDAGAVIDLVWGPAKVLTRYIPRKSYAIDTLWTLPGVLPSPLNYVQLNDEVENLAWFYGLEESATRRLRNYVEDADSELGMESVLQLLGLPDELSKVVQGRLSMEEIPGYRHLVPEMSPVETLTESALSYPNGTDSVSQINRALMDRPWIFTADGVVQLGASGILGAVAARRLVQGKSVRTQALLAVLLAGTGATEIALGRTYRKLKNNHKVFSEQAEDSESDFSREMSLMEELQAGATGTAPKDRGSDEETGYSPRHRDSGSLPLTALNETREAVTQWAQRITRKFKK